jgi:uncharacterized protein YjlB
MQVHVNKVTSRGYDVMGLYTAGRPRDVTKCGTTRYVLKLTCPRKNIFMLKNMQFHVNKVTSRGYEVMGLYTAGRPCDVTKCGTARCVLELTCLRKNIFMLKTIASR